MDGDMLNKLGLLQINPACCRACLNDRSSPEGAMDGTAGIHVAGVGVGR
jgi:hypothetical protein